MKKVLIGLVIIGILASTIVLANNPDIKKLLAETREITARYHNVDSAIDAGYISTVHCIESPMGVMGIHYINPALFDCTVDELQPEILLYAPTEKGQRLVGVEYFIPSACVTEAPILFGQPMDGPMAGHDPGMPEHYDLHVWLWQANPLGMFSEWNPKLSC